MMKMAMKGIRAIRRALLGLTLLLNATEGAMMIVHEWGWRALFTGSRDASELSEEDLAMLRKAVEDEMEAVRKMLKEHPELEHLYFP